MQTFDHFKSLLEMKRKIKIMDEKKKSAKCLRMTNEQNHVTKNCYKQATATFTMFGKAVFCRGNLTCYFHKNEINSLPHNPDF